MSQEQCVCVCVGGVNQNIAPKPTVSLPTPSPYSAPSHLFLPTFCPSLGPWPQPPACLPASGLTASSPCWLSSEQPEGLLQNDNMIQFLFGSRPVSGSHCPQGEPSQALRNLVPICQPLYPIIFSLHLSLYSSSSHSRPVSRPSPPGDFAGVIPSAWGTSFSCPSPNLANLPTPTSRLRSGVSSSRKPSQSPRLGPALPLGSHSCLCFSHYCMSILHSSLTSPDGELGKQTQLCLVPAAPEHPAQHLARSRAQSLLVK